MSIRTASDVLSLQWFSDDVLGLRKWADDETYLLEPTVAQLAIGALDTCDIRIDEGMGASREHAVVERMPEGTIAGSRSQWCMRATSRNGVFLDGVRRAKFLVEPGMEISIGKQTLIAESANTIRLRDALKRMLGWRKHCAEPVEVALRAVRLSVARRTILTLIGEDLLPIAKELHALTLGSRPFAECRPNPERKSSPPFSSGLEALAAAQGGTVCLIGKHPEDLRELLAALRRPETPAQMIVCRENNCEPDVRGMSISIPSLRARGDEVTSLVEGYSVDAAKHFEMVNFQPTAAEHAWLKETCVSLGDLQTGILRLAALRKSRSRRGRSSRRAAAKLLGISHQTLNDWLRLRRFDEFVLKD